MAATLLLRLLRCSALRALACWWSSRRRSYSSAQQGATGCPDPVPCIVKAAGSRYQLQGLGILLLLVRSFRTPVAGQAGQGCNALSRRAGMGTALHFGSAAP
jgi:hypothetical protein